MDSRGPSHEVFYWRVALGLFGFVLPALVRALGPRFPWQPICLALAVSGFMTGGLLRHLYYRRLQSLRRTRQEEIWNTVWVDHPDCRHRPENRDAYDR